MNIPPKAAHCVATSCTLGRSPETVPTKSIPASFSSTSSTIRIIEHAQRLEGRLPRLHGRNRSCVWATILSMKRNVRWESKELLNLKRPRGWRRRGGLRRQTNLRKKTYHAHEWNLCRVDCTPCLITPPGERTNKRSTNSQFHNLSLNTLFLQHMFPAAVNSFMNFAPT